MVISWARADRNAERALASPHVTRSASRTAGDNPLFLGVLRQFLDIDPDPHGRLSVARAEEAA